MNSLLQRMYGSVLGGDRKIIFAMIFILSWFLVFNVFADAGHDHGESIQGAVSEYPVVTVEKVRSELEDEEAIHVSGQVLSKNQATVYPRREGVVESLFVDLGDMVYAGQVLGYLRASDGQQLSASDVARQQARLDAIRSQIALIEEGVVLDDGSLVSETEKQYQTIDTDISVKEDSWKATQATYQAKQDEIAVKIASLAQQRDAKQGSMESAVIDVIQVAGRVLFIATDLEQAVNRDSQRFYREELYLFNQSAYQAAKKDFVDLYTRSILQNDFSSDRVNQATDVGRSVRALLMQFESYRGQTSLNDVLEFQDDLDEIVDHIFEVQSDVIDFNSQISAFEAERDRLESEFSLSLQEIDGDILRLQNDRAVVEVDMKSKIEQLRQDELIQQSVLNAAYQSGAVGRAIIAPFTGSVTKRLVSVGDAVSLDRGVYEVVDTNNLFVRFSVAEDSLAFVQEEAGVTFASYYQPDISFGATVSRYSTSIDASTGSLLVEAEVSQDDDRVLVNMSVDVSIPVVIDENTFSVSSDAVKLGEESSVWVVTEDVTVVPKSVTVLFSKDDRTYVTGDITDKDWVVISTPVVLKEDLEVDTQLK